MKLTTRGKIVAALAILVGLLGSAAIAGFLYARSIGLVGGSDPGKVVSVEIPDGASANQIGELLEAQGVVPSAFGFRLALYFEGGGDDIQAGTYELRQGLTPRAALAGLEQGPEVKFVTVTFPEGSWLTDFARILERETGISGEEFLELTTTGQVRSRFQPRSVDTLEGLLFPSTYQVVAEDDARSVATRLVDELEEQARKAGIARAAASGVSPYEALTVASMVEAEAKVDEERAMIARVIYNRLNEGIPLGIDATVLYALGEHKETLTQSDLEVDSPYNTRKVAGLPPTPIGAPGARSIAAAVDPADGDWLYYVLEDCEGHHAFSTSYDEFLENKAEFQRLEC